MRSERVGHEPLDQPKLRAQASELGGMLQNRLDELQQMMKLSPAKTAEVQKIWSEWSLDPETSIPAIDAFIGDIYSGLQVNAWTEQDREYAHRHLLILSGSDDQAKAWGAAGSYGPPEAIGEAPELLRIATCHDGHEIAHANAAGADAAMLSPVFATRTHPNIPPLGPEKFHALAALAEMPVIALGGMTIDRAKELGWTRWAAIDGLALKQDS